MDFWSQVLGATSPEAFGGGVLVRPARSCFIILFTVAQGASSHTRLVDEGRLDFLLCLGITFLTLQIFHAFT